MSGVHEASCRVGIDVGGTFNDFVLLVPDGRRLHHKEPSTPSDPSLAVERGLLGLLDKAGLPPEAIGTVVHGTTLALNAIIQRRGARLALVVSRGNRDVFEIARARMPAAYDFTARRETPLVPRDLVFEIPSRQLACGTVVGEASDADFDRLAETLRQHKVEAVAVMLLNAYRDARLEQRAVAALRARLPGITIIGSAAISPEIREYERALLAALNAYIHPLMESYFDRLRERLLRLGISATLFMTTNNGGTVGLASARARPIDTILSGPASGVIAAARHRGAGSLPGLLTFDMGGTSTDMSVIGAEGPEFTMQARVGDFPLVLPVVSVTAIGAGGGSIIWRDAQGVTKIGPQSAGAEPGPVCYGTGGTQPTVTDCYLATGILAEDGFLGGRLRLDRRAAMAALAEIAGETSDQAALRMADAALRVATAIMAVETGKLLARRGLDPQHYALLAYGGAGATHACMLADEAGLSLVVIPPVPATFCALGASLAELRRDYARTLGHVLRPGADITPIAAAIAEMGREAARWISDEGEDAAGYRTVLAADMRHAAQAFDVQVALPDNPALTADRLIALFNAEHERLYGFSDASEPVRVSTLRLSAIGARRAWHPKAAPHASAEQAQARKNRPVFHNGTWLQAAVIASSALAEGTTLAGPALLEQETTTIWVLPGWTAQPGSAGEILLQRQQANP